MVKHPEAKLSRSLEILKDSEGLGGLHRMDGGHTPAVEHGLPFTEGVLQRCSTRTRPPLVPPVEGSLLQDSRGTTLEIALDHTPWRVRASRPNFESPEGFGIEPARVEIVSDEGYGTTHGGFIEVCQRRLGSPRRVPGFELEPPVGWRRSDGLSDALKGLTH